MKTKPNDLIAPIWLRQVGENDFRPATPKEVAIGEYISHNNPLNKREIFAAMAMQGLLAKSDWGRSADDWDEYLLRISHASCELADALIEQLNKTEK